MAMYIVCQENNDTICGFFGCSVTALRYEMWDGTNHSHQLAIAKSLLGDGFR